MYLHKERPLCGRGKHCCKHISRIRFGQIIPTTVCISFLIRIAPLWPAAKQSLKCALHCHRTGDTAGKGWVEGRRNRERGEVGTPEPFALPPASGLYPLPLRLPRVPPQKQQSRTWHTCGRVVGFTRLKAFIGVASSEVCRAPRRNHVQESSRRTRLISVRNAHAPGARKLDTRNRRKTSGSAGVLSRARGARTAEERRAKSGSRLVAMSRGTRYRNSITRDGYWYRVTNRRVTRAVNAQATRVVNPPPKFTVETIFFFFFDYADCG